MENFLSKKPVVNVFNLKISIPEIECIETYNKSIKHLYAPKSRNITDRSPKFNIKQQQNTNVNKNKINVNY
jgi:hypothetical protein